MRTLRTPGARTFFQGNRMLVDQRFKSAGKPPVAGGRWSVRQNQAGRWRAWTEGRAKKHSGYFDTFAEAISWAQHAALVHRQHGPFEASQILKTDKRLREQHDRI